jgi:hypothetical protein
MKIHQIGLLVVASSVLALAATSGNSLSAQEISKINSDKLKQNPFKTELVNSCVTEATKQNVSEAQARSYCQCFADNLDKQDKALTQEFYTSIVAQQRPSPKVINMLEGIVKACTPQ